MTSVEASDVPEGAWRSLAHRVGQPISRVLMLSALMALAAVALIAAGPSAWITTAARPVHWWMFVAIAAGYALATRFVFRVEYRRESVTVSIFECSTALALAFMSPIGAIATRILVCVGVPWPAARPPAYKPLFNASMMAFQTALAFTIVRLAAGSTGLTETRFLVAVAVALTLTGFLDSIFVALAISCFEGGVVRRVITAARANVGLALVGGTIGTLTVAPALVRPEFVFFAIVPVIAVWSVLRQHGRLLQNHRDLEAVHGFSGTIGSSLDLSEFGDTGVEEAMRLLRADRGVLQVFGTDGKIVTASTVGLPIADVPDGADDPLWQEVLDFGGPVGCVVTESAEIAIVAHGRHTMLAVPITDAGAVIGLLLVADRSGSVGVFDAADISRAGTLAEQLSVSLRRVLLHAGMEHAALHDALTNKPNRLAFERSVEEVVTSSRRGAVAVLMLDLNRFKEVNDTLGHQVGDQVLIQFAARIEPRLEAGDVLARFGGDEFALLVRRPNRTAIKDLADLILADSFTPFRLGELDVVVTTSIGIAPVDGDDISVILRQADIAMYHAKRESTEIEVYRDEIDRRSPERLALLGSLREALDNEQLEVHYQPKVDIVTSTVVGAEALVRWNHPTRGWIPPLDFIQVAEESGMIKQVTDQVLRLSIGAVAQWAASSQNLSVSVNLSAHDLLDENLPHRIEELLADNRVPADKLILEITESALLADTPRTAATIDRLNRLGVRLSLDDFGTGYSSLGYLRRLPVSELKVDQSFVKNMLFDEQDAAIVRSTIDLGHNLGLQVVAEGIENMQTFDRLRELGCDIGQGYGIARPLSPEHFETWLQTTEYSLSRPVLNDLL